MATLREWLSNPALGLVRSVRSSQIAMAEAVDDVIENGGVAFEEAGTGTGKCHARGQPILMSSGTIKSVEEIQIGDRIMAPGHTFRTVLATNRGHGVMFDIVPVKGSPWRVNAEHILSVVLTDTNEVVDVRVQDYLLWNPTKKARAKLFRSPANFAPRNEELRLAPYLLGALLGDGCLGGASDYGVLLTVGDTEIVEEFTRRLLPMGIRMQVRDVKKGCVTYRLSGRSKNENPVSAALKHYGVLGTFSHDKFVPDAYKLGPLWVRLDALAGLLDTDGHLNHGGTYDFVSASERLAEDVIFIARSVGLAAYVKTCEKHCQTGGGGTYYRVSISGDLSIVPCLVPRKIAPKRRQKKSVRRTGFQIVPVPETEDFFGFTLDGDGRYLLGDFTVTHNSFAYGLPAVLSDKRVVISTGKKALQEQLVSKDLPHLVKTVRGAAYALLKGKGNYVCELRYEEFRDTAFFASIAQNDEVVSFQEWYARNREDGGTGDLSGWNFPWVHNVRVSECVKKHCPHADGCGYVRSRERAKAARIVVVNHALLAHDLALGGGKILGEYDVLVIDEGHQAPKFFRDAFSLYLNPRQPEVIARTLKDSDFEVGEDFARVYASIFSALPNRAQEFHLDATLQALFGELYARVSRVHEAMAKRGLLDDEEDSGGPSESARIRAKLRAGGMMLGKVRALCEIVLAFPRGDVPGDAEDATPLAPPSEWVKFTERRNRDEIQLVVTPLEVGPLVAPSLLGLGSVVVTSATLATANGMEYMAREYGLSTKQIRLKSVHPSPFDYASQSALYVSGTSPDPATRNADYYAAMCAEVHELLDASRGGAFVLCASTEDMDAIHDGIYKMTVATRGPTTYRLGKQTGASPEVLVKWFLDNPTSVLVGLKTYWEGVDIPGDALRLVVIPRLPFPNRGDVILTARKRAFVERLREENEDLDEEKANIRAWDAFDFQEAIMDLKQGAGRLIRTETDRGIVALLDRRAYRRTKGYSAKVRAALPHPETSDKGTVLQILRGFGAQALARSR